MSEVGELEDKLLRLQVKHSVQEKKLLEQLERKQSELASQHSKEELLQLTRNLLRLQEKVVNEWTTDLHHNTLQLLLKNYEERAENHLKGEWLPGRKEYINSKIVDPATKTYAAEEERCAAVLEHQKQVVRLSVQSHNLANQVFTWTG